jgi:pimeloyl-ACP methyl ester carboxylesterase
LIAAPTLLVFGARDPVISARKDGRLAASLIPGAKLVVMPSGHAPFAEVPEAFLAAVRPFLGRCAAAGERDEG